MKRSGTLVLLLILAGLSAHAQDKLEIFGYYEPQYLGSSVSSEFYQLFTNKLRLDLRSELSDKITFAANLNVITYHGKTEWNVLEFLSSQISDGISQAMKPLYVLPFENDIYLDNAFLKLHFKRFDLTAGKQQISLGNGYAWNPTDVFNTKDVLDPTYEQPGHTAMRVDIPLSGSYTVTALYSPESTWSESGKLFQFKGLLGRFDYALTLIETEWTLHDYTRFEPSAMNFAALTEQRRLLGGSAAGELLGLGVWAEYAYNWMEKSLNFYELVLGWDYTFDFQTYVMLEFYRNTMGKSDPGSYDLNDWMRFFAAEQKSLTRDQLFVLVQHPATDLLYLGLQSIFSLSDGSLALVPTANYSLSDNVELFAYLNFNTGGEGTAYAPSLGSGGLLRLRVYF